MKTEELMTRDVCTCSPQDTLEHAARIMWESDVGSLVVTDGESTPIGMITDRDIAMAAYTQGVALRDARVQNAMATDVVTCLASSAVHEVEEKMRAAQIRRVPVIDSTGKLVGLVALADIARSVQSSTFGLTEVPGLAKTLIGITARREREPSQQNERSDEHSRS